MKVLHVELGRHLYGGARQVAYLLNGLARYPDQHLLVCAADGAIAQAIDHPRVQIQPLAFSGDADLGFLRRLRRLIRQERPHLVHVHSRRGDLLAALAARLENCPAIHSRRVDNPPRWLDRTVKFPLFAKIITISEGIRQVLLKAGVPEPKLSCIPSAVDTDRFHPGADRDFVDTEFNLRSGHPILAMIAQLIPRKGHRILFDALPGVLARHPDIQLLVFGQGPLLPSLREAVASAGWADRVRFAGFRSDLERILPAVDLVIHPALMEGLGVSLLESAACGVAMVASRVGGIPEIVRDSVNGYLVEPGDGKGLACAIVKLLDDPDRRVAFGAAGRTLALAEFSIPRMVEDNRALYLEMAACQQAS
ncbi:MAG: glycosyltransferase family 4 protein [Methylococcaceae bacterium]|nr:glycosyltransferase family 4 protein [Methylococcaceae bacterium]